LSLHSRWTDGKLEFYDGTQTICIIPGSTGTFEFGESGEGMDVRFYGDTTGKSMLWDESADQLVINGSVDITGGFVADAYYAGTTGTVGMDKTVTGGGIVQLTVVKGLVTVCTTA